ncbi:hypothetical protein, partial [Kocuria rhizophila]|uniref:hypothetical protein n=1 Tax=Kocuria rhizophila TaxID=72000 RepID=UPI0037036DD8
MPLHLFPPQPHPLTRPQLSLLTPYPNIHLTAALLHTDLAHDPSFHPTLSHYFPA